MKTIEHLEAIYDAGRDIRQIKLDGKELRLIDDWSFDGGKWFVIGEEFGPRVIVHADSEQSAYEAFIDEENVVPDDNIHEAYGFYITNGNWRKPEQGPFYLCTDRDDIDEHVDEQDIPGCTGQRKILGSWKELDWAKSHFVAFINERADNDEHLDIIEGYTYQSNATDSGIVDVSDHLFMWELTDLDRLTVRSTK